MQLKIKVTCGDEVKWAGASQSGLVYYGGPPPETGIWKLSIAKIEDYFDAALKDSSYGDSVETFVLGFEIAELEGWDQFFTSMSRYTSYRPKTKALISVGQLNWPDVKDLTGIEQFQRFSEILLAAIERVAEMKRKQRRLIRPLSRKMLHDCWPSARSMSWKYSQACRLFPAKSRPPR